MDCNLEMVCAASHHGVTFYNFSASSNIIFRSYLMILKRALLLFHGTVTSKEYALLHIMLNTCIR